jgi:Na+:H+ antiporter, NhaA family
VHVPPEYQSAVKRRERVDRFVRPIQVFMHTETSGGIALLIAAVLALLWANSPWDQSYHDLLAHHFAVDLGFWSLDATIHYWINDAAMVIFFFVVGLEIKREIVAGELSDLRRMAVPVAGAAGGMIVPAAVFLLIVRGGEGASGWGIPVATDIAFAIGVLALVGSRVPFSLRVMLLALAIVDDIGGILVIAVFYTADLQMQALGVAGSSLVLALLLRQSGIWYIPIYVLLGVIGWAAAVESGVHPTIVGVLFGLLAPWKAWYDEHGFEELAERQVSRFRQAAASHDEDHAHEQRVAALQSLSELTSRSIAPLDRLQRDLQPLVAFVIVPVFAFANAGVSISPDTISEAITAPVSLGVFFGLLLGKPVGILIATWLAVRAGAELPAGVRWAGIAGIGVLGGIGFTVSLLITELSFVEPVLLTDAKLAIIFASLLAGVIGFAILRVVYGGTTPLDRRRR